MDIELESARTDHGWTQRLIVLSGVGALFAAVALAVWLSSGNEATGVDEDATPEPDREELRDADQPDDDGPVVIEIEYGGRFTGVDSLRLPLLISPDDGLVDGQIVTVTAEDLSPHATVGVVQCAGEEGNPRGEGSCDIGDYTLANTDENGRVATQVTVRRFISNAYGEIDCAAPGELACAIAVANIADYDESAVGRIWFDPTVEGVRAPTITVDRSDGLHDGDSVSVSGANFVPGEPVVVGQCVIGGSWSIFGCWEQSRRMADAVADDNGAFEVTVEVSRILDGGLDCFSNQYGCRIAARTTTTDFLLGDGTAANPVRLFFDGTTLPENLEWGIAYALAPDRDLTDGEQVVLRLANLERSLCEDPEFFEELQQSEDWDPLICEPVLIETGVVEVQQCVDLAAEEEYCTDTVAVEIVEGAAEITMSVQREFERTSGELVDCAEPGRQCELRITGDIHGYVPLRFRGD